MFGCLPIFGACRKYRKLGFMVQELTARYLEQLSSGVSLSLAAFRPSTKMGAAEIERITKVQSLLLLLLLLQQLLLLLLSKSCSDALHKNCHYKARSADLRCSVASPKHKGCLMPHSPCLEALSKCHVGLPPPPRPPPHPMPSSSFPQFMYIPIPHLPSTSVPPLFPYLRPSHPFTLSLEWKDIAPITFPSPVHPTFTKLHVEQFPALHYLQGYSQPMPNVQH